MFVSSRLVSLALSFAALVSAQTLDSQLGAVQDAFYAANIPSALSIQFNPSLLLQVHFKQSDGSILNFNPGDTIQVDETATAPTFSITGNVAGPQGDMAYVVTMFDPDAPTPAAASQSPILHFLGSDFVPDVQSATQADLTEGSHPFSPFIQPAPTAGSPPHRYTWLLWEQPAGFDQQTFYKPVTSQADFNISAIENFNIPAFTAATGLSQPVAGSFVLIGPQA